MPWWSLKSTAVHIHEMQFCNGVLYCTGQRMWVWVWVWSECVSKFNNRKPGSGGLRNEDGGVIRSRRRGQAGGISLEVVNINTLTVMRSEEWGHLSQEQSRSWLSVQCPLNSVVTMMWRYYQQPRDNCLEWFKRCHQFWWWYLRQ